MFCGLTLEDFITRKREVLLNMTPVDLYFPKELKKIKKMN
jgi:hypothetical protein